MIIVDSGVLSSSPVRDAKSLLSLASLPHQPNVSSKNKRRTDYHRDPSNLKLRVELHTPMLSDLSVRM